VNVRWALALVIILSLAVDAEISRPANPWTIVSMRVPRPGEVPFEEASGYLWPSSDANNVPGPDSLVAHARTDETHHSYLELEDLRTGRVLPFPRINACLPRWSPNGEYLSCIVWKSSRQMDLLTVMDVATRTVLLDPGVDGTGEAKWSPDSRSLVAERIPRGSRAAMLCTISVPDGKVTVLDTTSAMTDYEFSWSPDGRWIAFSRPTETDYDDATIAADLWIADATTGAAWPVLETPDWVESNPLWITNRSIQVDRTHHGSDTLGGDQRLVIELSLKESDSK
jgi:Tol biopolymer transport system component